MDHFASCANCASRTGDSFERRRQLQLLALLEHPDALPAEFALRLACELMVSSAHPSTFRCETVEEIGS